MLFEYRILQFNPVAHNKVQKRIAAYDCPSGKVFVEVGNKHEAFKQINPSGACLSFGIGSSMLFFGMHFGKTERRLSDLSANQVFTS